MEFSIPINVKSILFESTIISSILIPELKASIPIASSLAESEQGSEVAVSIEGVTIGRQIEEGDELLVDVPESHARKLTKMDLTSTEREILDELMIIHRKDNHFWGR